MLVFCVWACVLYLDLCISVYTQYDVHVNQTDETEHGRILKNVMQFHLSYQMSWEAKTENISRNINWEYRHDYSFITSEYRRQQKDYTYFYLNFICVLKHFL